MNILNKDNAKTAVLIQNIANPEWGAKRFNYNSVPLNDNQFASSWGAGCNSAVLFEKEFKFWQVIK